MTSKDYQCPTCGVTVSAFEEEAHKCATNNVIPRNPARVPQKRHYALLVFNDSIPDPTYVAYEDRDIWLQEIKNLEETGRRYSALRVIPARVKRIVEIEVYDDRGKALSPKLAEQGASDD